MAGGDIKLRLGPGEIMPVTTPGDYIYMKFCDRDLRVTITDGAGVQKPVVMTVGDKYRPGPFKALNIENTNQNLPAKVIMVIGDGDFNRQIIQGEVNVITSLRKADGELVPDDRKWIDINVIPEPGLSTDLAEFGEVRNITAGYTRDDPRNSTTVFGVGCSDVGYCAYMFEQDFGGAIFAEVLTFNDAGLIKKRHRNSFVGWGWTSDYEVRGIFQRSGTIYLLVDDSNFANPRKICITIDAVSGSVKGEQVLPAGAIIGGNIGGVGSGITVNAGRVYVAYGEDYDRFETAEYMIMPDETLAHLGNGHVIIQDLGKDEWGDPNQYQLKDVMWDNGLFFVAREMYAPDPKNELVIVDANGNKKGRWRYPNLDYYLNGASYMDGSGRHSFKAQGDYIIEAQISRRVGSDPEESGFYLVTRDRHTEIFKFKGWARNPNEGGWAGLFKKPSVITADTSITVSKKDGRLKINGEVIKTALNLHFGKPLNDGYLDSVYAVEIQDKENGGVLDVWTGSESFERRGIADNFTSEVPNKIRLYVDSAILKKV